MSRYTATTNDREMLKRIVATLLSLAAMAERASMRSRPVLWFLLLILRPAEARSRKIVIDASEEFGLLANLPGLETQIIEDNKRFEALRLAATFRMLAATLEHLATLVVLEGSIYRKTVLAQVLSRLECGLGTLRDDRHVLALAYDDSS